MTVPPAALSDVPVRYLRMPHAEKGMAVGLFGGSFNPPHAGHALVAEIALRRLALDQLWWIVTPGNPLKNTQRAGAARPSASGFPRRSPGTRASR